MKKRNIIRLSLFICLVICFATLAVLQATNNIQNFDTAIYNFVSNMKMDGFFKVITEFGDAVAFLLIILFIFVITKKYSYIFCTGVNLAGIALLNFTLKNIFLRERPAEIAKIIEDGYSFPSGHSAVSAAFYTYILILILKECKTPWIKCISIIVFPLLILLIGISRIYLGVHFASDVLAGFSLGLIYTILYIQIINMDKIKMKMDKLPNIKNN